MKSHIVLGDALIQYYSYPRNGSKTVLFLHGWRSDGSVWNDTAQKLMNDIYSVYALDLPGFGGSPAPRKPYTVSDYVTIVTEFIKKMGLRSTILIGHSFGGRVAIKLAASHPKLVKKLVLIDSAGFARTGRQNVKYIAKLVKPIFSFPFMSGVRSKIYRALGAEDYIATPFLRETLVNVIKEDLSDSMTRITSPTLLIWGAMDRETPRADGERMQSHITNASLQILPDAGHYSFLDAPTEFYRILKNFLKQ